MRAWWLSFVMTLVLFLGMPAPSASAQEVLWVDRVSRGTGLALDVFDGSVYVAGAVDDTAHLRAYTLDGELRWARRVGRARYDEAYGVAAGPSGVYVTGSTYGVFPGERDRPGREAFVARYGLDGRFIWARQIGGRMRIPLRECGGQDMICPDSEEAFGVAVYGGSVYVTGRADTQIHGSTPRQRGFLRSYDVGGNLRWTRVFRQEGWGIDAARSGVFVTSFLEPQIRRFRAIGRLVWTRDAGQATFGDVDVRAGAVFLAGDLGTDGVVQRRGEDGRIAWTTTVSTKNVQSLYGVVATAGAVLAVGTTYGTFPDQPLAGDDWDLLIAELDHDGSLRGVTQIGGPKGEQGRGIAWCDGTVFVTSETSGPFLDLPPVRRSMLVIGVSL